MKLGLEKINQLKVNKCNLGASGHELKKCQFGLDIGNEINQRWAKGDFVGFGKEK